MSYGLVACWHGHQQEHETGNNARTEPGHWQLRGSRVLIRSPASRASVAHVQGHKDGRRQGTRRGW